MLYEFLASYDGVMSSPWREISGASMPFNATLGSGCSTHTTPFGNVRISNSLSFQKLSATKFETPEPN